MMATDHDTARADRLLRQMHPVFSHDLPNQMVALQGLLQLMEQEGAIPAGAAGQEYFSRLNRVARKAAHLVHLLKEFGRLSGYEPRTESVPLPTLLRETAVGLAQQAPELVLETSAGGNLHAVSADPRSLRQAVVEIVRCLADRAAVSACTLKLACRSVQGRRRWR